MRQPVSDMAAMPKPLRHQLLTWGVSGGSTGNPPAVSGGLLGLLVIGTHVRMPGD
jgi:hypothetical protein